MVKIVGHFKAEPTEYVRITAGGSVRKQGKGVSAFYMPFRTSFESVSTTAMDQGINFKETSNDNQEVTISGGFVYRIDDPETTLDKYNFSIDPVNGQYTDEGDVKVPQHILQLVRSETRKVVQATPLEELLVMSDELSNNVADALQNSDALQEYGVSLEMLYFSQIAPKPEIARALETEYRESLLEKADKATYQRRALAVESERQIQENEMKTQIDMEQKRGELVELEGKNVLEQAGYKAQATKTEMDAYQGMEPAMLTAHALYQIGLNAENIGNLTITPDVISPLLQARGD